jgi:hypothetical protein
MCGRLWLCDVAQRPQPRLRPTHRFDQAAIGGPELAAGAFGRRQVAGIRGRWPIVLLRQLPRAHFQIARMPQLDLLSQERLEGHPSGLGADVAAVNMIPDDRSHLGGQVAGRDEGGVFRDPRCPQRPHLLAPRFIEHQLERKAGVNADQPAYGRAPL